MSTITPVVSSMAVGWIPYRNELYGKPGDRYVEYAGNSLEFLVLFANLFHSGNPDPPGDLFASDERLRHFVRSKEYRGLLALTNIRIEQRPGVVPRLHLSSGLTRTEEIGYTPVRVSFPGGSVALWHSKGHGTTAEPARRYDGSALYLSHEVQFRVGRIGWTAGRLLTSYWLPLVWMRVDYKIQLDGAFEVMLSGSYVPSQKRYFGKAAGRLTLVRRLQDGVTFDVLEPPVEIFHHDMDTNTPEQLDSIFKTTAARAEINYGAGFVSE